MNLNILFVILWFLIGMIFTSLAIHRNHGFISIKFIPIVICGALLGPYAIFNYFTILNPKFYKDEKND